MAPPATTLEVPATALTSALGGAARPLTRCARHGLAAATHLDVAILAPGRPWRWWYAIYWFHYVEEVLEIVSGKRARTPVTGWPLCARCWRRCRRARVLARTMLVTGLVGLVGGLGAGLVLRLASGQPASAWLMAPALFGLALMLLAAVPATAGRPDRVTRAETTRDGVTVRFTDPHPEFAGQLRALLGDQVRRSPGQPVAR